MQLEIYSAQKPSYIRKNIDSSKKTALGVFKIDIRLKDRHILCDNQWRFLTFHLL